MTRRNEADSQLVDRLRARDAGAVAELAAAYGARIHQLAFRYMKNREDAEEVAQDVLMKVVDRIDAFRGDSALSSWIYRITFNAAMSRLRNGKFRRPFEVGSDVVRSMQDDDRAPLARETADWSHMADEAVMRSEMRARLAEAMRDLPPIYRIPVVLRDLEGLSTEEASEVLKVKAQTLKSRLHRGRLILRQRLADFANGLSLYPAT